MSNGGLDQLVRRFVGKAMAAGVTLITNIAHPVSPIARLTRSRRPASDSRAARNTPLTAAELAAPDGVLRAVADADCEREAAAPWSPTLDSASSPRRSRRQPARPRSSRVGSRAMAMAAAKVATTTSDIRQQCWTRGVSGLLTVARAVAAAVRQLSVRG